MYFDLRGLLWFIVGFSTFCESKVILNLHIRDYKNPDNKMYNGKKCETFSWMNDHCDPMFHICVTSRYKCDVLRLFISHWKNRKYLSNVLSRKIRLNKMPESLKIDIEVQDHDRYDAHDHIAMFNSVFYISGRYRHYSQQMNVSPSNLNVQLYTSLTLNCEEKYYGSKCDTFCEPKIFNYDCNEVTGEKVCSLDCGRYGRCRWNIYSRDYICSCKFRWTGNRCQFIHYNNCSSLNCKRGCVKDDTKISCVCRYDHYIETCTELLPLTTPVTTTIVTITTSITTTIHITTTTAHITTTTAPITTTTAPITTTTAPITTTTSPITTTTTTHIITTTPITTKTTTPVTTIPITTETNTIFTMKKTIITSSSNAPLISTEQNVDELVPLAKITSNVEDQKDNFENMQMTLSLTTDRALFMKSLEDVKDAVKQTSNLQIESSYSSTTIIIICLLCLLCICIITLIIVIGKKKQKFNSSAFQPGTIPHVIYRPEGRNIQRPSSIVKHNTLPDPPQFNYDTCSYYDNRYEKILINRPSNVYNENEGIYQDPIIENLDSLTYQTEVQDFDSNDNDIYEVPIKL